MSRTITFFFVITAVARMGIALSITCQETAEKSSCETVNSWLCDINDWMKSMKEWKDRVERVCSLEDLGTEWMDLFSCEDSVNVTCSNQNQNRCESDEWFNCTICYCRDGNYKSRQSYNLFWRRKQLIFRESLKLYDERLRFCGKRPECSERTVPSTKATDPTFTSAPRSVTETMLTTEETITSPMTQTETVTGGTEANYESKTTAGHTRFSENATETTPTADDTMTSATIQMDTSTAIGGTEANYESATTAGRNCSFFLDVMFVVDGSKSIGADDFEIVREWLINQTLEINSAYGSCARQQVLQYSNKDPPKDRLPIAESNRFVIPFTLNDDFSNCEDCFRERIANMTQLRSQTFTYYALRRAMEVEFPNSERYSISKRIVIVVTDGEANDGSSLDNWYRKYENDVIPFAVGVGDYASFTGQLQDIANGGESFERVILIDDFETLRSYMKLLEDIKLYTGSLLEGPGTNAAGTEQPE